MCHWSAGIARKNQTKQKGTEDTMVLVVVVVLVGGFGQPSPISEWLVFLENSPLNWYKLRNCESTKAGGTSFLALVSMFWETSDFWKLNHRLEDFVLVFIIRVQLHALAGHFVSESRRQGFSLDNPQAKLNSEVRSLSVTCFSKLTQICLYLGCHRYDGSCIVVIYIYVTLEG